MRREDLTLNVRDVGWIETDGEPRQPTVVVGVDSEADADVRDRLTAPSGDLLDSEQTDVAFRLLGPVDDPGTTGVVSVTDRVTGDFILELNEDADDVLRFIRAARRYGEHTDGDGEYRVVIRIGGEEVVTYEKNTFLVYNETGELLRQHSLIPSGVEL
ncbi:MAG: DUF5793 family protein [Halobacteriaceae archaeon]